MKICFVLPKVSRYAVGGYKIVFEYANRLTLRGHQIQIIFLNDDFMRKYPIPQVVRDVIGRYEVHRQPTWFELKKTVRKRCVHIHQLEEISKGYDWIVATSYDTVNPVSKVHNGCKKAYLIQDFEIWNASEHEVTYSYSLGMRNIVISSWLKGIVQQYSIDPVICIPNAIDTEIFKVQNDIQTRNNLVIGLLYHRDEHKGLKYSFKSLEILKQRYPDLRVEMFGAYKAPINLPEWYNFSLNVSPEELCNIYNRCSIFMCSSVNEGFGLTGAESMACGCAFVTTGYQGVYEYAIDGVNALISPVKNPNALADNVDRLFQDDNLRVKIATRGAETIKNRSWEKTVKLFEDALE